MVQCFCRDEMVDEDNGRAWNISHTNEVGDTPLHVACEKGLGSVALMMLRHADARHACCTVSSWQCTVCQAGLEEGAMAMLGLDAVTCEVEAQDSDNDTAVHEQGPEQCCTSNPQV